MKEYPYKEGVYREEADCSKLLRERENNSISVEMTFTGDMKNDKFRIEGPSPFLAGLLAFVVDMDIESLAMTTAFAKLLEKAGGEILKRAKTRKTLKPL